MATTEQTVSTWGAEVIGKRVHPTIVQALAPFLPKPTFAAPRCPRGAEHFDYTLAGVDLVCHIEFEPGEPGDGWDKPAYPDNCTLIAAYVRDINVANLLSDKQAEQIECAFLAQREEA